MGKHITSSALEMNIQVARQHPLDGYLVGACGQTVSNTGFDIKPKELVAGVVRRRPHLVKLIAKRLEPSQRAETVILFRSKGPAVVEVVSHSPRRVVLQIAEAAGIVRVEDRVVDHVPCMQMQPDDRPDLGGNRSRLPIAPVDAELKVGSVEKFVVVCVGPYKQLANLEAVERRAVVRGVG